MLKISTSSTIGSLSVYSTIYMQAVFIIHVSHNASASVITFTDNRGFDIDTLIS